MTRDFAESPEALAQQLFRIRAAADTSSRLVVGIVGAPGSGKSTLSAVLAEQLDSLLAPGNERAIVVPMDGYHLDNVILEQHGTRAVKGSPQTFDVDGVLSLVQRLTEHPDTQRTIYAPLFDRQADLARNAALAVEAHHSIVLVEGNYLLLQREGWRELQALFGCSIMLGVPEAVLEQRLVQRWLDHGHTAEDARLKATANDIPNARIVLAESATAHLYYKSVR